MKTRKTVNENEKKNVGEILSSYLNRAWHRQITGFEKCYCDGIFFLLFLSTCSTSVSSMSKLSFKSCFHILRRHEHIIQRIQCPELLNLLSGIESLTIPNRYNFD